MDPWLKTFELLSYAANVALVVVAIISLKSLRLTLKQIEQAKLDTELTKADIVLRSKREAGTLAAVQCERFAKEIGPAADKMGLILKKHGLHKFHQPTPDFTLDENTDNRRYFELLQQPGFFTDVLHAINLGESMAIYFEQKLADEELAFPSLAKTFCGNCQVLFPYIAMYRPKDEHKLYQSTVALYHRWSKRMKKNEYGDKIVDLNKKLSTLDCPTPINPTGTEF